MWNLLHFLSKYRLLLLFVLYESIALTGIIGSRTYHYSKFFYRVDTVSGHIRQNIQSLYDYLSLRKHNEELIKENTGLKNRLQRQKNQSTDEYGTSLTGKYRYIPAHVIHNSYTKSQNFLTIDKGQTDGIKPDMGVVLPDGVAGIILHTSAHFSTVLSILNRQTGINVMLKKSHHTGSLTWDSGDYRYMNVEDLPIQAAIEKGDTLVTGGKSLVFPEGIPVGVIESFEVSNKQYTNVKMRLLADMSALFRVYVVENPLAGEQRELEKKYEE